VQHECGFKFNGCSVIGDDNYDAGFIEKTYIYKGLLIPDRLIQNSTAYELFNVSDIYHIHGIIIRTFNPKGPQNEYVENVILCGHHPNKDIDTGIFCLNDYKTGAGKVTSEYNRDYFNKLLTIMKIWYWDHCYHHPDKKYYDCKKMNSISIQVNRGE